MKQKKSKKEFLFFKSINLLKTNPSSAGLMVLFDVLFLVSFFGLQNLFGYLSQSLAIPVTIASFVIFIVFSLIYYLVILFAYSFFKYNILYYLKSLFKKTEFSFGRVGQFYSLNIIIAGIFFAIMLALNYVLINIKVTYQPYVFIIFATPYVLFLYVTTNIAHSLFYEGESIKDSLKKGFSITFRKMRAYREIILVIILSLLILWLFLYSSGYLLRLIVAKNYTSYLITYSYFKQITILVLDGVFYFIILINRVSFYTIAKEIK